jgi:general stress protein 26
VEANVSTVSQQHLYDLIKDVSTALLVTHRADGGVHVRPMAVAKLEPDTDAYFATSLESPKVREIEADPRVAITFQGASRFAVVQGTATVVTDQDVIEELWSEDWRLWFPGGKDDPSLCLLRVEAKSGEYWDRSGFKGLKFLFAGLKAVLAGTTPDSDEPERHAKIAPGRRA